MVPKVPDPYPFAGLEGETLLGFIWMDPAFGQDPVSSTPIETPQNHDDRACIADDFRTSESFSFSSPAPMRKEIAFPTTGKVLTIYLSSHTSAQKDFSQRYILSLETPTTEFRAVVS